MNDYFSLLLKSVQTFSMCCLVLDFYSTTFAKRLIVSFKISKYRGCITT